MDARNDNRFDRIETRMQTQFLWLLGIMITMWVTIIAAIVALIIKL
jgi:hypothetical protein